LADIKDVSNVIAPALREVSVNGVLDIAMDGDSKAIEFGNHNGEAVEVAVTVKPMNEDPT
jgi:hypothetical protein